MEVKYKRYFYLMKMKGCNDVYVVAMVSCLISIGCCIYVTLLATELKYLKHELIVLSETCFKKNVIVADDREWVEIKRIYEEKEVFSFNLARFCFIFLPFFAMPLIV